MISVAEAQAAIFSRLPAVVEERVDLSDCLGRVLAQAVHAERDQPPFDRAMMDGFAIQSVAASRQLECVGVAAAGQAQQTLQRADQCIEIMTGAPLPQGADCVIPVELTQRDGQLIALSGEALIQAGQFVHPRGSDHAAGTELLAAGTLVGAPELAVLASCGSPEVAVRELPSIGVVASGDELVDVGEPIAAHRIRRSNDYAVEGLLRAHGLARTERVHLLDDPQQQTKKLAELLAVHDGLVLTGGVSMGRFDYIPKVLRQLQVELVFHRVAQRPGKPMWFGLSRNGQPVFALPGNPVSALVCARRYVVPALQKMLGIESPSQSICLQEEIIFKPSLTLFMPVTIDSQSGQAKPKPTNTSGDFSALAGSSGLVELAAQSTRAAAGTEVPYFAW